jgi:hypothetical protein
MYGSRLPLSSPAEEVPAAPGWGKHWPALELGVHDDCAIEWWDWGMAWRPSALGLSLLGFGAGWKSSALGFSLLGFGTGWKSSALGLSLLGFGTFGKKGEAAAAAGALKRWLCLP